MMGGLPPKIKRWFNRSSHGTTIIIYAATRDEAIARFEEHGGFPVLEEWRELTDEDERAHLVDNRKAPGQ